MREAHCRASGNPAGDTGGGSPANRDVRRGLAQRPVIPLPFRVRPAPAGCSSLALIVRSTFRDRSVLPLEVPLNGTPKR